MISPVMRVNPFDTFSTVYLTCSALSDTRLANWRCFRTEDSVSTGFNSGLQGGSLTRETLVGSPVSWTGASPRRRGRRRHACTREPAPPSSGDGGPSLLCQTKTVDRTDGQPAGPAPSGSSAGTNERPALARLPRQRFGAVDTDSKGRGAEDRNGPHRPEPAHSAPDRKRPKITREEAGPKCRGAERSMLNSGPSNYVRTIVE